MSMWAPLLEQAREQGRIRENIENAEVLDWMRHVHAVLTVRDDESLESQRLLLQKFFLPSILKRSK